MQISSFTTTKELHSLLGVIQKLQPNYFGIKFKFWISAIVNVPGLIAFQIFGTDEIQSWAH